MKSQRGPNAPHAGSFPRLSEALASMKPARPVPPPHAPRNLHARTPNTPPPVQAKLHGRGVVQRALPKAGRPDTKGFYNAQGGAKTEPYTGGRPAKFSKDFRRSMFNHWHYNVRTTKKDVELIQEQGGDFYWLPEDVYQLDHKYAWDNVERDLFQMAAYFQKEIANGNFASHMLNQISDLYIVLDNKGNHVSWQGNQMTIRQNLLNGTYKVVPSMYGARMYYHDVDNLRPMTSGLNASKGTKENQDEERPKTSFLEGEISVMFYNFIDKIRNRPDSFVKEKLKSFAGKLNMYADGIG